MYFIINYSVHHSMLRHFSCLWSFSSLEKASCVKAALHQMGGRGSSKLAIKLHKHCCCSPAETPELAIGGSFVLLRHFAKNWQPSTVACCQCRCSVNTWNSLWQLQAVSANDADKYFSNICPILFVSTLTNVNVCVCRKPGGGHY